MFRSVGGALLATVTWLVSTTASAALPQPGLWTFDGESNGKPGRGIQIDRQDGDRIIVTYFGYRADGSATFLQAGGHIEDDGKTFSAELNEYKNGRAMDGEARTGELAKMVGNVRMEFDTSTAGSITLPGEEKRSISRIAFNEHRNRLNNQFFVTRVQFDDEKVASDQAWLKFSVNGDQVLFDLSPLNADGPCSFKGGLNPAGDGFTSKGTYTCGDVITSHPKSFYRLDELKVDPLGFISGTLNVSNNAEMSNSRTTKLFGYCYRIPDAVILGVPGQGDRCSAAQLE
ncbi:hypothetical protein G7048_28020 (plasmid) [Diaphorobacter sp. HDW4B]|uniref:hypothetical protein n=1 Tax=Diaphorobacter sp. HDW4B TaxID=2714925 RepID=UPI0014090970|nr:hypothetical protein [Diaphorobacter sp. HDW4B]QIL74311.1 hypothetical protein G7048_28020 [Diaphorobacter sp. HDW4B]